MLTANSIEIQSVPFWSRKYLAETGFGRRNHLQFITLKWLCNLKAVLPTWVILIEMQSIWGKKLVVLFS